MQYKFLSASGSLSEYHGDSGFILRPEDSLERLDLSDVLHRMPESVAREQACLPVFFEGETLHVACVDSDDIQQQDKLRFLLNCNIQFYQRTYGQIKRAITFHYGRVKKRTGRFTGDVLDESDFELAALTDCEEIQEDNYSTRSHRGPESPALKRKSSWDTRDAKSAGPMGSVSQYGFGRNQEPGDGMFFYTIEEGRKALAYRPGGKIDVLEGPARVWKGWTRYQTMPHHVAHPGEFLLIRFKNGTQEHLSGPAEVWFDPRVHEKIEVEEGLDLGCKRSGGCLWSGRGWRDRAANLLWPWRVCSKAR